MQIVVTGAAGFIGFHLSNNFLDQGFEVTGIDNLTDYYDVGLKKARLEQLNRRKGFSFRKIDLAIQKESENFFSQANADYVFHLAAQAGVRYSITHPHSYIASNIAAFLNVLEGCRHTSVKHLFYASSSSVYGEDSKSPFSVEIPADKPVSFYAATKRANELMAYSYNQLYSIPMTGLRFFTVYGPWGRPDMAYFKFTQLISAGSEIDVYNNGKMERDFTYIDDVIRAVDALFKASTKPSADEGADYKIYNIGRGNPTKLSEFIEAIEKALGKKARKRLLPMQMGDVTRTYADVSELHKATGFVPSVSVEVGISNFVQWYAEYYKLAD